MKIQYIEKKFAAASMELIETAEGIINEYDAQGYKLTLRQLYYQFVARDLISNNTKSYKRLGSVINDARLAGLIDWYAIEDPDRMLRGVTIWDSPQQLLDNAVRGYKTDLWENQAIRPEVWVEKQALVGVISSVCRDHRVDYFACRGYNSQSAQWRAGRRFERYAAKGQKVLLLHLGDHDPSGIDMTRDNRERLGMFVGPLRDDVIVKRIALNYDQIEHYNPPPNPTKLTDTRAAGYISTYGTESWELDALEPKVINQLIQDEFDAIIDRDEWELGLAAENADKAKMRLMVSRFDDPDDEDEDEDENEEDY